MLISSDFTPRNNRPEGFSFITEASGVGGAARLIIKLASIYGGGSYRVGIFAITPAVFGQNFLLPSLNRKKRKSTLATDLPRPRVIEFWSKVEILFDTLKDGAQRNRRRGWYRVALNLNPGDKRMKNGTKMMIFSEKQELIGQVSMLEQYISANRDAHTQPKYSRSKKIKKRNHLFNPITTKYLVQEAWDMGNQYLLRLKKTIRESEEAVLGNDISCLSCIGDDKTDVEKEAIFVISDFKTAERYFMTKRLYALNRCWELASINLDSVTLS